MNTPEQGIKSAEQIFEMYKTQFHAQYKITALVMMKAYHDQFKPSAPEGLTSDEIKTECEKQRIEAMAPYCPAWDQHGHDCPCGAFEDGFERGVKFGQSHQPLKVEGVTEWEKTAAVEEIRHSYLINGYRPNGSERMFIAYGAKKGIEWMQSRLSTPQAESVTEAIKNVNNLAEELTYAYGKIIELDEIRVLAAKYLKAHYYNLLEREQLEKAINDYDNELPDSFSNKSRLSTGITEHPKARYTFKPLTIEDHKLLSGYKEDPNDPSTSQAEPVTWKEEGIITQEESTKQCKATMEFVNEKNVQLFDRLNQLYKFEEEVYALRIEIAKLKSAHDPVTGKEERTPITAYSKTRSQIIKELQNTVADQTQEITKLKSVDNELVEALEEIMEVLKNNDYYNDHGFQEEGIIMGIIEIALHRNKTK